jgi:hypothetical protein
VPLADDLVYQRSVGGFGWGSTPAALQVMTRAVQWELRGVPEGYCFMCGGDGIGVLYRAPLSLSLSLVTQTTVHLFLLPPTHMEHHPARVCLSSHCTARVTTWKAAGVQLHPNLPVDRIQGAQR